MAVCRDIEQRTLLGIRMTRPKCRQKRALIAVCRAGGIFDRRSMEQVVLYTIVIRYVGALERAAGHGGMMHTFLC
jgi:hypothetical protein